MTWGVTSRDSLWKLAASGGGIRYRGITVGEDGGFRILMLPFPGFVRFCCLRDVTKPSGTRKKTKHIQKVTKKISITFTSVRAYYRGYAVDHHRVTWKRSEEPQPTTAHKSKLYLIRNLKPHYLNTEKRIVYAVSSALITLWITTNILNIRYRTSFSQNKRKQNPTQDETSTSARQMTQ